VYGPVRTVVWQGSAGDRRPYADQTAFWEMARPGPQPKSNGMKPHFLPGRRYVAGAAPAIKAPTVFTPSFFQQSDGWETRYVNRGGPGTQHTLINACRNRLEPHETDRTAHAPVGECSLSIAATNFLSQPQGYLRSGATYNATASEVAPAALNHSFRLTLHLGKFGARGFDF
jgi:hypothetical protein